MNKVILVGRICHEINVKYLQSGLEIVDNTIAINEKTKNGEVKTTYIKFVVFGKSCLFLCDYAKKGNKVLIEGKIDFSQWIAQNGEKKSEHKILVEHLELLEFNTKQSQATPAKEHTQQVWDISKENPTQKSYSPFVNIDEDEIPF